VTATYTDNQGGAESPVSAATAAIANLANAGSVSISGIPTEGETLTATVSDTDGVPATIVYQWQAGGSNIGADSPTYLLTQAEVGQTITVTATYTDNQGGAESPVSAATAAIANLANAGSVSISGIPTEGETLTATVSDTDGVPATIVYQWQAGGANIGADSPTYLLTQAEVGQTITVTATYTDNQGGAESPVSSATAVVTDTAPVVSGFARYLDINKNAINDLNDQLIIPFDQAVSTNTVISSDFDLPVSGDGFGTGATVIAGPANNEVTIILGTSPNFKTGGNFSIGVISAGSPSGVDVAALMMSEAIEGASGVDAEQSVPIDMIPAFVDSAQSLGSGDSQSIVLGDVDGVTGLDIVVANAGTQGNVVYTNDGAGNFTAFGSPLGTNDSQSIVLGDVDGVNGLDIVVANAGTQANRVYLNDGAGNFTDSGQSLGTSDSQSVILGDVNGDGDLDIVVANASAQGNRVYINDINDDGSTGVFTDSGQSLGTSDSQSIVLGDVDGITGLDIVVANAGTQGNVVYTNDGAGNFTAFGSPLGTNDSQSIVLGDVDGVTGLDIVVANAGTQANRVYLNDGSGNFTGSGQSLGTSDSQSITLGDMDDDADLDMMVVNAGTEANHVYTNDGAGNFTDSGQLLGTNDSRSVAVGDVDGDGDLDKAVVNGGTQGNRVYLGSLSGT